MFNNKVERGVLEKCKEDIVKYVFDKTKDDTLTSEFENEIKGVFDKYFKKIEKENPPEYFKGKGRIIRGAEIFHDFGYFEWPKCRAPECEYLFGEKYKQECKFPEMIFDVEWSNNKWECKAYGYGGKKEYGNGPILVSYFNNIEILDEYTTGGSF